MCSCPHCGRAVFRKAARAEKLKASTRIVVLHKSGDVEINCPHCSKGVLLPLAQTADFFGGQAKLRKAHTPRLIARKA